MGLLDAIFGEKHSVDRFIGGNKRDRAAARKQMERRFRDQERFDKVKIFEREKTVFEKKAIQFANKVTDELREKYGLSSYEVPEKNFHVLKDNETVRKRAPRHGAYGEYKPEEQAVVLIEQQTRSAMLRNILHEMTHFKSYTSYNVGESGMSERRMGLATAAEGEPRHFEPLTEALTEEVAKRLLQAARELPELREETQALDRYREEYPQDVSDDVFSVRSVRSEKKSGGMTITHILEHFSYKRERAALHLLLDKLHGRNPQTFRDKNEWFDMFASAMFNGHLLELARSIEKTFGEGSFRKLGEQKTGEDLLKYVESL